MANGPKKILIVEDNPDSRHLLKRLLETFGYEIVVASTGEEGFSQANLAHPDLILMDIGLPGMSGDQATAKLKAEPTTKDIPVVVHTAFGRGPSTKRAIEAGAAEVLCKPVRIPDLKTILEKYLRGTDQLPSDSLESA